VYICGRYRKIKIGVPLFGPSVRSHTFTTVNNTSTAVCKKIPANGTQLKYFHPHQNMELMEGL